LERELTPELVEILKKALEVENEKEKKFGDRHFEAWEVDAMPHEMIKLRRLGLVKIVYRSNRYTIYRLADPEEVRRIVRFYEEGRITGGAPEEGRAWPWPPSPSEIPRDLFDTVVGYDDIKALFAMALRAEKPVHFLLIGPPASGKTALLLELARIPGSFYALGGSSTKAGITAVLFDYRPRILLIDELDKMDAADFSSLLSLMETGIVCETKYGRVRRMRLECMVAAACNSASRIPPELLSRFMKLELPPYDDRTLREVMVRVLMMREGRERGLAEAIADELIRNGFRDVRDAVRVARLARTPEEAGAVIRTMAKYRFYQDKGFGGGEHL